MSRYLAVSLVIFALAMAGCRDKKPAAGPGGAGTIAPAVGGAQRVRFMGVDGVSLTGILYGRPSTRGVLLVSDAGRGGEVWQPFAADLAAAGYAALAIDGGAAGPGIAGIRAAAEFLRGRGSDQVALIGEGASAAAALAAATDADAGGVAALSPPADARGPEGDIDAAAAVGRLDGPVVIAGALGDADSTSTARRLYDAAREPRTLALVPGTARGADMLRAAEDAQLRSILFDFLREAFADRPA